MYDKQVNRRINDLQNTAALLGINRNVEIPLKLIKAIKFELQTLRLKTGDFRIALDQIP